MADKSIAGGAGKGTSSGDELDLDNSVDGDDAVYRPRSSTTDRAAAARAVFDRMPVVHPQSYLSPPPVDTSKIIAAPTAANDLNEPLVDDRSASPVRISMEGDKDGKPGSAHSPIEPKRARVILTVCQRHRGRIIAAIIVALIVLALVLYYNLK